MADRKILLLIDLFLFFVIPQVYSEVCAPVEKDIDVLRNQKYWKFEVDNVVGCEPFYPPADGSNVSSTCVFYFSICQPVPSFCPENSGICLANKINYGPKFNDKTVYTLPKKIGGFQEGGKANFDSEWNYFTVIYDVGDPLNASMPFPQFPLTVIKFQCNHSAKWQETEDHKVPFQPVNITATSLGKYQILFDYSGACPGGGGGGGGGGGDEEPSKPLSVGSIILILFFPGLFLYCVVGVLINRGSGKTGREMIPNAKFWSDLPGLIADGFSFAIAKITCSEMSTTQETYNRM